MKRIALGVILVCGCETPSVVPSEDPRQSTQASRIEGNVVVQTRTRGNAIVLLYDATKPPPPDGTGRPISFTIVPKERIFNDALYNPNAAGPFTADFSFSLVPQGNYLIRGFLDRDGCLFPTPQCRPADFSPWYSVTSEPNQGDIGGGAVDAITRQMQVISISIALIPQVGVSVSFADAALFPLDRPVFRVTAGDSNFVLASGPQQIELTSTPIQQAPWINETQPAFLAKYIDPTAPADADGVRPFWPKVFVRRLDESGAALADSADPIVLGSLIDPTDIVAALTDSSGNPRSDSVPITRLRVTLLPRAFNVANPAAPVPLPSVPTGRYALVVMQHTGQTWRVPNELQPGLADSFGFRADSTQGFVLQVQ